MQTLGLVTMDFKKLCGSFDKEEHRHTLKGLQAGSSKIISNHHMEKILNKGHSSIIAQFDAIQVMDYSPRKIHLDLKFVLDKHHQVFETRHDLPPLVSSIIMTSY